MTAKRTTRMRRIGLTMLAASLALASALVGGAPAAAQEGERESSEISKTAFWDAPLHTVIPPTVVKGFPPQVVCIVRVQACTGRFTGQEPDEFTDGYGEARQAVGEGMTAATENDPGEPVSPVMPETLPVSITTGQPRYRSAILFELPKVPEGHQVDSFVIYLKETDPTGGISSPALRQAVLAGMTCPRGCDGEQFEKIMTSEPYEQQPLDVEICPVSDDPFTEESDAKWESGESQDPDTLPETDCILGSSGQRGDDGTWTFDLTYAMEAWAEEEIPNLGVVIRPGPAPNFAYGDPDSSFNKQVSFETSLEYTIATSEKVELVSFDGGSSGSGFSNTGTSGDTAGSSGGFAAPSSGSSGGASSFSAPAGDTPPAEPAPEVAAGDAPAAEPATEAVAAGPEEQPSAWYVWLLAPLFLGGMWLTAQSLTAPVTAQVARDGAMTRLLRQQQAAASRGPQLA